MIFFKSLFFVDKYTAFPFFMENNRGYFDFEERMELNEKLNFNRLRDRPHCKKTSLVSFLLPKQSHANSPCRIEFCILFLISFDTYFDFLNNIILFYLLIINRLIIYAVYLFQELLIVQ